MSLQTTKEVVRHCNVLYNHKTLSKADLRVVKLLMSRVEELHKSYIETYEDAEKAIQHDRDPIGKARALSLRFVKDRIFQRSLRREIEFDSESHSEITSLVKLIDEYLSEVSDRIFPGVKVQSSAVEKSDPEQLWDEVAELRIDLAHAFDALRSSSTNREDFRAARISELSRRKGNLNHKMDEIRKICLSLIGPFRKPQLIVESV